MRASLLAVIIPAALWAETAEIRLLSHVTSDRSPAGTPVRAVVVRSSGSIPKGTLLRGEILRSARIHWGLVRERAMVQLRFSELESADGDRHPVSVTIRALENTREQLARNGKIRGVLAASTPGGWVRGLWHRPRPGLFGRAAIGLTGAAGTISSHASLGPAGAAGMFVARTALFRLPEPEIHLGPGAEMIVDIDGWSRKAEPARPRAQPSDLSALPHRISRLNGKRADDIVNVVLRGTRNEIEAAFRAAGWYPAEPLTPASFRRAYRSWVYMHGYPTAPVSPLLYQGIRPDMVFQKSFNTIAKRHHIRIWEATAPDGKTVWAGAATHDTGITLSRRRLTLTHVIDPRIDLERDKVLADLDFAGCIQDTALIARPELATSGAIQTDGALADVSIGRCSAPRGPEPSAAPRRPRDRWPVRIARRTFLESRQYLLRGNLYYYAYRGASKIAAAKRPDERAAFPLR